MSKTNEQLAREWRELISKFDGLPSEQHTAGMYYFFEAVTWRFENGRTSAEDVIDGLQRAHEFLLQTYKNDAK